MHTHTHTHISYYLYIYTHTHTHVYICMYMHMEGEGAYCKELARVAMGWQAYCLQAANTLDPEGELMLQVQSKA